MKYINHILLVFVTLSFFSCQDFLEEVSQDETVPKTVQDYRELLYHEAYRSTNDNMPYLSLMTDELTPYTGLWGFKDFQNLGFGYYAWQGEPEMNGSGTLMKDRAWEDFYASILACNIVIHLQDDMLGTENEKKDVVGEAYFWRAYSYLTLVNLYAKPYDKATASSELGVPINTHHGVQDVVWERSSIAEVYALISSDIKRAVSLMNESRINKNLFRVNHATAALLASRIFLYQKDYDSAITYGTKCIDWSDGLYNISEGIEGRFINQFNPEILCSFGRHDSDRGFHATFGAKRGFKVSSDLLGKYDSADKRKSIFFDGWSKKKVLKSDSYLNTVLKGKAFRTAEAYLNRAEAYEATSMDAKAIEDLNELRLHRYSSDHEVVLEENQTLAEFIQDERWRELCFEEQRWFDLRRTTRPVIEHTIAALKTQSPTTFVLEANDLAYTLPIPVEVMEYNPKIKNNQRPDRAVEVPTEEN